MKSFPFPAIAAVQLSPSMRREWIEMTKAIELLQNKGSPSMRREWIEIWRELYLYCIRLVSLHAEGVD